MLVLSLMEAREAISLSVFTFGAAGNQTCMRQRPFMQSKAYSLLRALPAKYEISGSCSRPRCYIASFFIVSMEHMHWLIMRTQYGEQGKDNAFHVTFRKERSLRFMFRLKPDSTFSFGNIV